MSASERKNKEERILPLDTADSGCDGRRKRRKEGGRS